MKFQRHNLGQPLEISVLGKDRPPTFDRHGCDENIDDRNRDTLASADIAGVRCCFIVCRLKRNIRKSSKNCPQPLELSGGPNSRQYFLSNETDEANTTFTNQLPQFSDGNFLTQIKATFRAPQSERPH
jgi:hypothetical protein